MHRVTVAAVCILGCFAATGRAELDSRSTQHALRHVSDGEQQAARFSMLDGTKSYTHRLLQYLLPQYRDDEAVSHESEYARELTPFGARRLSADESSCSVNITEKFGCTEDKCDDFTAGACRR
jgi:hypothetical protein